ncbi:MAG: hypothetical protein ACC662_07155 [Planctomycetota bacterium]
MSGLPRPRERSTSERPALDLRPGGDGRGAETPQGPEERLLEVERERDELWAWLEHLERYAEVGAHARGLAHDLGNVLTSLMAGTELCLLQEDATVYRETLEQHLEASRQAAARLTTFRRFLHAQDTQVRPVTTLGESVEDVLHLLAYPVRKIQVIVERDLDDAAPIALARPRLLQVLASVVLRILRSPAATGGCLRFLGRDEDTDVVLTVRVEAGSGNEGIPPTTTHPEHTRTTGLGLLLARRILDETGGRLEALPGDPAGFAIHLPLALGVEGGEEAEAGSSWARPAGSQTGLRRRRPRTWIESPRAWSPHG